ncbi:MAG TPA: hypothetical protein VET24_07205 [Actinomycetota bacterium]|nr:hypothetical protein [Actinomycetota bacterium]
MKRLRWVLAGAAVLGGMAFLLLRSRHAGPPLVSLNGQHPMERRSRSDPEALKALMAGSVSRLGLDLERLQELKSANYKPLMEYLGYIQVQRGGNETLLFVRMRDLDEMAALAGQSREEFVKQFKKLGVLLSMN